jgi:hypothetical protein
VRLPLEPDRVRVDGRGSRHAAAKSHQPPAPVPTITALQRSIGNRAVARLVAQRNDDPWAGPGSSPPKPPTYAPTSKQGRWYQEFRRRYPKFENIGWVAGPRDDGIVTPTGVRVPATKGNMLNPLPFYEKHDAAFIAYQGFIHYAEIVEANNRAAAVQIALALRQKTGRDMPRDNELDLDAFTHWQRKAAAARQTVEFGLLAANVVMAGRALYGAMRARFGRSTFGGGPGAASVYDEAFAANRVYRADAVKAKHGGTSRNVGGRTVSPEPKNGQRALDNSVPINERRRVGVDVDNQEIVVLDRTGNLIKDKKVVGGEYHGHVRKWDELSKDMKDALKREGVTVDKKGKITVPESWKDD